MDGLTGGLCAAECLEFSNFYGLSYIFVL